MYEDKYVRRGEIYAIRSGSFNEPDSSMTRPGLIISAKTMNDLANAVIVAMLTTTENNIGIHYGPIMNTGRKSYVCCERLMTVDKARLGRLMGELSENQMKEVESRLDEVLDLGYVDDTPLKEKESEIATKNIQIKELKEEVAKLKVQIAARADDDIAVKAEIAMWQRLYEKVLDQLCTMKLTGDLARKVEKKTPATVVEDAPIKTTESLPVVEEEPKMLDINTAKFDEFRKIGLDSNLILNIINKRPHKKISDLKGLPGMTTIKYNLIEKKICCVVQPEPKKFVSALVEPDPGYEVEEVQKVNINTATGREIMEKLGTNECYAYSITSHRNKNGLYSSLEELKGVKGLSIAFYGQYKDRLTVGESAPSEPEKPTAEIKKVNVNTAKAVEIKESLGCSKNAAYAITSYRKTNGSISKLEELASLPWWSESMLAKHRDKLEI